MTDAHRHRNCARGTQRAPRNDVEIAEAGITPHLEIMQQPQIADRRRVCITLVFAFVIAGPASLNAQSATASCLRALHGSWRGPGAVLGRAIVMEQEWTLAVADAFTQLRMRHLTSDSSSRASFEGLGLYRASGDSVRGSWHDSRGITFAVDGRCANGRFTSTWSGVERGRTVYERRGDSLVVIDSVYPPTGAGREFGRSVLVRRME